MHHLHLLAALPHHVPWRAGGGGGFGGGGSGGGGGGGGGLFIIIYLLFRVVFWLYITGHPVLGTLVLVALVVLAGFGLRAGRSRRRTKSVAGVPGASFDLPPRPPPEASIDAIRAHDPAFDTDTFLASVERWFFALKHALAAGQPQQVRRVLGDGPYREVESVVASYQAQGHRPVFGDLAVANTWLLTASSGDGWDQVQVRIRAGAVTQDLDAHSGYVLAGDHAFREWYEDWTLARPATATTHAVDLQQVCENCGAPLHDDLAGTCATCHAPVTGEHDDWQVTRILRAMSPVAP